VNLTPPKLILEGKVALITRRVIVKLKADEVDVARTSTEISPSLYIKPEFYTIRRLNND